MLSLASKRVVVTGGSGALGEAVVGLALKYGADVHIFDMVQPRYSTDATFHQTDLLDTNAIAQSVQGVGPVSALFNLAGGFSMGASVHERDDAEWQKMFALNVDTLRNMVSIVVPSMLEQGGGKIVNVGAWGAMQGAGSMGAYGAAKSVVMRLTESMSEELKAQSINVNAVLPSIIDTPANRAAMPDADYSEWVSTANLANVICFLGSDDASAVHGALIPVRGLS